MGTRLLGAVVGGQVRTGERTVADGHEGEQLALTGDKPQKIVQHVEQEGPLHAKPEGQH